MSVPTLLVASPKGLTTVLGAEKGLPREGFREAGFDSDEVGSPKGLGRGEEVDAARVAGSDLEGGAPKGFATPAGLAAPSRAAGDAPTGGAAKGDAAPARCEPAASELIFCGAVVGEGQFRSEYRSTIRGTYLCNMKTA